MNRPTFNLTLILLYYDLSVMHVPVALRMTKLLVQEQLPENFETVYFK